MEISLIFRIAAVGILVSILCQVLIVPYIYELFETIQDLFVQ